MCGKQLKRIHLFLLISGWPLAQCCTCSIIPLWADTSSSSVSVFPLEQIQPQLIVRWRLERMMSTALKLMHSRFISEVQTGARIAPRLVTECGQECSGSSWQWQPVLGWSQRYPRSAYRKIWPLKKKKCSYKPTLWRNYCRKIVSDLIIGLKLCFKNCESSCKYELISSLL